MTKGYAPMPTRRAVLAATAAAVTLDPWSARASAIAGAARGRSEDQALHIAEQGSFAVGGTVITRAGAFDPISLAPAGQTLHGDHARIFYQIPVGARRHPLIFLHGNGQFSKTWETTPDGREGYQTLFLRRRYAVYLIDQPRRGGAGQTTVAAPIETVPNEQERFDTFRIGIWPNYFPGVQFSDAPGTLDQFFRQMTPNTGPFDLQVVANATVALFDRVGPGVLVTHSQGGGPGWQTAIRSPNVRGVVAYEPGSNFVFPAGNVPAPIQSAATRHEAIGMPLDQFRALTRIPIMLVYGDNIPGSPVANPAQDRWRAWLQMARLWRDAVNQHGGQVSLIHLPEIGITGNTHFAFSDINNRRIADLMAGFLQKNRLDG